MGTKHPVSALLGMAVALAGCIPHTVVGDLESQLACSTTEGPHQASVVIPISGNVGEHVNLGPDLDVYVKTSGVYLQDSGLLDPENDSGLLVEGEPREFNVSDASWLRGTLELQFNKLGQESLSVSLGCER